VKRLRWNRNWLVVPAVALAVLLADQWSKAWVMQHLTPMRPWYPLPFLGDLLAFTYITNTGVVFGLLRDQSIVLVLLAFVVVIAIIMYARYLPLHRGLVRLSLGLQLGGAAGNLADRVRLGHVIDFIDLGIGRYRWFTSNLADVCIVTGVIILAVLMLLERDRAPEEAKS
jgi:signal peptidase II